MIVRVARAFGLSPLTVARAPFAETAWTFGQLNELERQDALLREGEQLRGADLTAAAFHDPKLLEARRRTLLSRLSGTTPRSPDDAKARARAMLRRMQDQGAFSDILAPSAPVIES